MAAFDDLISSLGPQGSSAWGTISNQLQREGADQPTIVAAQNTFTSSWNSLSTTFGMDADSALTGAQQYTYAASTIAGAVSTVQGLVSDFKQIQTPAGALSAVNMFTGAMVGIAVAAGAVSAGIGAVIVAAVGIAADVLSNFLGSAPGVSVCPGIRCNPAPDWVINCTCVWGAAYSPGANGWRSFPTPAANPEWFSPTGTAYLKDGYTGQINTLAITSASSQEYLGVQTGNPNFTMPIEILFPEYGQLTATLSVPLELLPFHAAFVAAWKANKEFTLNGQKAQDDAVVLQHCIRVWNKSHSGSSTFALSAHSDSPLGPIIGENFYEASLVAEAISNAPSDLAAANYISNGTFLINTGPALTFDVPVVTSTSNGTSLGMSILVGSAIVVGSAALGVGAWALATHQSFLAALKGVAGFGVRTINPLPSVALEVGRGPTTVQTLLFPRPRYSESRAKAWARAHGYSARKTDITANNIRVRQRPPFDFKKGSFRTISLGKSGVKAVVGHLR